MPKRKPDREQRPQISRAPNPITPLRGGGSARANPVPTFDQKPEWGKWAYMLTVELWQAVALSLDIEPDPLPVDSFADYPKTFKDRLHVACNHAENGARWCTYFAPYTPYSTVSLSDFAEWARSLKWPLPDCFPCAPAPNCVVAEQDEPIIADTRESAAPADTMPAPAAPPESASTEAIREAMRRVYDNAERGGSKPPNVKQAISETATGLRSAYHVARKDIERVADEPEFKRRRIPKGEHFTKRRNLT